MIDEHSCDHVGEHIASEQMKMFKNKISRCKTPKDQIPEPR